MNRLNRLIERLRNEPAVVIGILGMAVVAALQSLAGNEVIGADIAQTVGNLLGTAEAPGPAALLVGAIVTRFFVTGPATAAALKAEVPDGYVPANP